MIHDYMCRLSLQPYRNSSYEFQQYQLGVGGVCAPFDPPAGYWCVSHFFFVMSNPIVSACVVVVQVWQ